MLYNELYEYSRTKDGYRKAFVELEIHSIMSKYKNENLIYDYAISASILTDNHIAIVLVKFIEESDYELIRVGYLPENV